MSVEENTQVVVPADAYAIKDAKGNMWMDAFIGTSGPKVYSNGLEHALDTEVEPGCSVVDLADINLAVVNVVGGIHLRFPQGTPEQDAISQVALLTDGYRRRMLNTCNVVTNQEFQDLAAGGVYTYPALDDAGGHVRVLNEDIMAPEDDGDSLLVPVRMVATVFIHRGILSEEKQELLNKRMLSLGIAVGGPSQSELHLYLVIEDEEVNREVAPANDAV